MSNTKRHIIPYKPYSAAIRLVDETYRFEGGIKNENIIEQQQRYVTLGPVRNGTQRAVFDEVVDNNIETFNADIAVSPADDLSGYDDNFVDLNDEKEIFIPKQYRSGSDKSEEKSKESSESAQETIESTNKINALTPTSSGSTKQITEPRPSKVAKPTEPAQPPPAFSHRQQEKPNTHPSRPPTRPPPKRPALKKEDVAADLRTGRCFASIFYLSSPSPPKPRITFSHFAMTVSVDQCARTCHEFNCAIAHFDPSSGRCQFNPSTAFALKEGQCPAWPSKHYRNNVVAAKPLRIFCVQCRRSRKSYQSIITKCI
ncbi:unnamed protein product [Enterobius vermicularis]|uniref:Apple domain-containing protein n=1 Tax=Enterobius vermicularis TaxID=51028 RepID=A0A158Q9R6_ENTVE|nr:unnamed protein product [Enterobius vermicularis]